MRNFKIVRSLATVLLLVISSCCFAQGTVNSYQNPLDVSVADPFILKDNGIYYLYGTTYDADGFSVYTSTDMVHWTRRGLCWKKTSSTWAQGEFWAPEVMKAGSTYYFYYTGHNPAINRRNICVASSSSPLGPFIDVTTPLLPTDYPYIDGHPYQDPITGKRYLFAVRDSSAPSAIVVTELAEPPIASTGVLKDVMTVSQAWEGSWVEAPFIIRHNNWYYMMYSARWFWESEYSVGYATASSPMGPWTKSYTNPIMQQTSTASGPGHNSAILSPDGTELFTAYHTHLSFDGGGPRQLAIDRLSFNPHPTTGQPAVLSLANGAPTTSIQPLPSGAVPRSLGTSDAFNGPALNRSRWNTFGEESTRWRMVLGQLVIETENGDLYSDRTDAHNIFLQHAPPGDFTIETQIRFAPLANYEQAFLLLWEDQSNYVKLGSVFAGSASVEAAVERKGQYTGSSKPNTWGNVIRLKMEYIAGKCYCYASSESNPTWSLVGSPITFAATQPQVGLGAFSPASGALRNARFDYFNFIYPSAVADWQLY